MLSRRLLVSTLIQAGLFSLVCYIISLLISAAVSIPGGPTDGIDNARTNAKCPSCNNYHSGGSSRNVQSTFRYPSVVNHNTANRMEHDRSLGVINTGPPKTLHNRTPFSVTNDSPSKSSTGGSTNGRQTLNPPRKRPLLHGSSRLLPEPKCSDRLCTEFLSEEDKSHFRSCLQKVEAHKGTVGEDHCRFMPQTHRAPVALASYPGSGNTWLRGLLETATGVCTGFEFCDISMRVKGFAGENIVSGAVLVVKTHGLPYWKGKKRHGRGRGNFDSAVFLVRNPLDALVSEWNRRIANDFHGYTISLTSHVKSAGKEWFGEWIGHDAYSSKMKLLNKRHLENIVVPFTQRCPLFRGKHGRDPLRCPLFRESFSEVLYIGADSYHRGFLFRNQSKVGGVFPEAGTPLAVHDKRMGRVPRASCHPGHQVRRPSEERLSPGQEDTLLPPDALQRQRGGRETG